MNLEELKNWVNSLPEELMEFTLVNGEWGEIPESDLNYRVDKPIIVVDVDEENKEIIFLHQKQEEVDKIREGGE